jgi:hypothetical protein
VDDDDRDGSSDEAEVLRDACGRATEAFEYIIRVRGHLYSAHQLTGRADFLFEEAADLFERAGRHEDAERLRREVVGRNLLDGRWTFQIVEEFDDGYYAEVESCVRDLQVRHANGRRHDHEAQLKEERRTKGRPGHEARPDRRSAISAGSPRTATADAG